jgi:ribosomal protein S18 acetylase RimI-like enzyme
MDLEIVRACEERLVNVWPAVSTLLMDGWVVRFAHGYSGRANSASAVVPGAAMPELLLDTIEQLYGEAGLPPCVRVTPLAAPEVEPLLMRRGYRIKDQSRMMILPLERYHAIAPDPRVRLEGAPSRRWLADVSSHQEPTKRSPDHLFAIVGHLRVPAAFATLEIEGRAVGFGMCAIDRGYAEIGSIMLDGARRGQGFGRLTVDALLAWAARMGAESAFLQVDETNAVARKLYARQGFTDLCGYKTMIRDGVRS